ncbi:hypothetical protein BDV97DRAFT_298058 [Delphinella strobiligena]|nr:hypothetical protein BDV97DRAFT_298058 [Delphinella strobiligena]
MKTTSVLSALAVALPAFAAPAPVTSAGVATFGGVAIASATNLQFQSINANGTHFYLLRDTSTYTPPNVSGNYNQTSTVFTGGDDTLSLYTAVPGGQQVYVNSIGLLSFTEPHSADTGSGSKVTGFSKNGKNLQFEGNDWYACELHSTAAEYAFSIYAASVLENPSNLCTGISFLMAESTGTVTPAWEYL